MRTNGKLFFSISKDDGSSPRLNEDGEPIIEELSWQECPCFISDVAEDRKARYEDGQYTDRSYEILVQGWDIEAEFVRLERRGKHLGEFTVKSIRRISLDRSKILV